MKEPREIVRAPIADTDIESQLSSGRYQSYSNQGVEGFRLFDYWRAIRKRLWLVVGIAVLMTTLTTIYMARKPNIYQAHGVVQVDLEQTNPDLVTDERQRPLQSPDPAYLNTQLQLLVSDALLRRVIKEHNLDSNKDFQVAKAEDSSGPWRAILRSLGLATDPVKTKDPAGAGNAPSVATTEEIAEATRLAPYVDIIKKNLDVEPRRESRMTVKDTRLIDISYRSGDPELAAYVVNSIGETFVTQNQEKRSGTSRKTNDFLQERIASQQADIKNDEEKLQDMSAKARILKTGEGENTIVVDRLSGLNKQLLESENKRKDAEADYMTVASSPDKVKAIADTEMARYLTEQENNIRALEADTLKKVADLRQDRARLLEEFKEKSVEKIREKDKQIESYMKSLNDAKTGFQRQLDQYRTKTSTDTLENLKTKYLQAKDAEDKTRADFDKEYNEAQVQNQAAVNIKLLQQTLDTNKGVLANLQKQVSGNDIAAEGTDNNISVSEIAIPPDTAASPRRLAMVVAASFLSTIFGMGLELFLEYLDDTIRSTEEVENYLQLPALAAIPTLDSLPKRKLLLVGGGDEEPESPASPLLISADPRSALAEAYRHLRTSILLSTAGRAPRSLLITSSLPSEGKTTTATNTAISLAQTGAQVLIIDGDMRRPRLHSIFGIDNRVGLSTLLSSELSDADVSAAVRQDEKTKLYMITSGPVPPNPAELIGSTQMAALLKLLTARFTHVVIDSPPITSFTDGVLIGSLVDGVILVVNAGHSSRQVVRRSRQLLNDTGAKIFGVVLNNVNLASRDNYYYYQTYYQNRYYQPSSNDE